MANDSSYLKIVIFGSRLFLCVTTMKTTVDLKERLIHSYGL